MLIYLCTVFSVNNITSQSERPQYKSVHAKYAMNVETGQIIYQLKLQWAKWLYLSKSLQQEHEKSLKNYTTFHM